MINVGVLGAGHLGSIHLKLLERSKKYNLIGLFDPNISQASSVSKEIGCKSFTSVGELISQVDVVDIVTPTLSHYECAKKAIQKGKHVFIEKPIANTIEEAEEIMILAQKYGVKGQVGHVERFNPAFMTVKDKIKDPMFVEVHRLAEFNPRGNDVPVVLDLMIHDIDILLHVIGSKVKNISANGISIVSGTPDIANARLEFENGCVANLTASRISMKTMRKSRFFQKNAYISVDFYEKKSEIVQMRDVPKDIDEFSMIFEIGDGTQKQIYFEYPEVPTNNAILDELETFADAINNNTIPLVTLKDGLVALKVAKQIVNLF